MTRTSWLDFCYVPNSDPAFQWDTEHKLFSLADVCTPPSAVLVFVLKYTISSKDRAGAISRKGTYRMCPHLWTVWMGLNPDSAIKSHPGVSQSQSRRGTNVCTINGMDVKTKNPSACTGRWWTLEIPCLSRRFRRLSPVLWRNANFFETSILTSGLASQFVKDSGQKLSQADPTRSWD